MTTIVMQSTKLANGDITLKSYSDTLVTGRVPFVTNAPKVFTGENYIIGGAGNAAIKDVLEDWALRNKAFPYNDKVATFEMLNELTRFLAEHRVMGPRGSKVQPYNHVLVATEFGIYEIASMEPVNLGSISAIGSGAAMFDSLHVLSEETTLDGGLGNALYGESIEAMVAMAITADPKSEGYTEHTVVMIGAGRPNRPGCGVTFKVDRTGKAPYLLHLTVPDSSYVPSIISKFTNLDVTDVKATHVPSLSAEHGAKVAYSLDLRTLDFITDVIKSDYKEMKEEADLGDLLCNTDYLLTDEAVERIELDDVVLV